MNSPRKRKPIPSSLILFLLFLVVSGILIFGLNPKDLYLANNVSWLSESPGIRFGKYGVAFTDPFLEQIPWKATSPNGFSFEISLRPKSYSEGGFNFIIVLSDGNDTSQLVMGQWRSYIIIMNGDDYTYERRIKRASVDTAKLPTTNYFISAITGNEGTKVYINGQLFFEKKDLTLRIPNESMKARLVLGNSVYGRNSWEGIIYGLAFYQYELTPQQIHHHYSQWLKEKNFAFAKRENPYALYLFEEKNNSKSIDHSGRNNHIHIPERMKILKKKFLGLPVNAFPLRSVLVQDVILNLLGFIPLGFILTAALTRLNGAVGSHSLIIAVLLGFLLSLSIESVQSFAPTRDSSMLDLTLNTMGTLIGAVILKSVLRWAKFRN